MSERRHTSPLSSLPRSSDYDEPATSSLWLLYVLWVPALWGGNLLITVITYLGYAAESRMFTVPLRLGTLLLSLIVVAALVVSGRWRSPGPWIFPIVTFFTLYTTRIIYDGYVRFASLPELPEVYLQRAIGVAALPMLAFCFLPTRRENRWLKAISLLSLFATVAFPLVAYRSELGGNYRLLQYRDDLEVGLVSPIDWGHCGAMAFSVGIWILTASPTKRWLSKVPAIVLTTAGVASVVVAGARGPAITAVVTGLLAAYLPPGGFSQQRRRQVLMMGAFLVPLVIAVVIYAGEGLLGRFALTADELSIDTPSESRGVIWRTATEAWLDQPLTGAGLVVYGLGSRHLTHNIILEGFYTTGVLGGACFLALLIKSLHRCLQVLHEGHYLGWVALIFLAQVCGGLGSYTIDNPLQWYFMMMILAIPAHQLVHPCRPGTPTTAVRMSAELGQGLTALTKAR